MVTAYNSLFNGTKCLSKNKNPGEKIKEMCTWKTDGLVNRQLMCGIHKCHTPYNSPCWNSLQNFLMNPISPRWVLAEGKLVRTEGHMVWAYWRKDGQWKDRWQFLNKVHGKLPNLICYVYLVFKQPFSHIIRKNEKVTIFDHLTCTSINSMVQITI